MEKRCIKIKKLEISPMILLLLGVSWYFKFIDILLIGYGVAVLHELSHIFVAKRLGVEIDGVELLPFGLTMRIDKSHIINTDDEIKISFAGPVSNIIIAYLTFGFYNGFYKDYIIISSMMMGIFNLLPCLPLDGGRIIRAMLVKKYGFIKASSLSVKISCITGLGIILLGFYVFCITGFNFSFLLIGIFLIANMTEERKNACTIIIKDILYSKKKLGENEIMQGNVLVTGINEEAKTVLKRFSYDKYTMIAVLDEKMNIFGTVTETKLIESMSIYGVNVPMKKIVEL